MSQSRHTSLSLRTQLSGLTNVLVACDPTEFFATQRLVQQLGTTRAMIEKEQVSELVPLCDVALRLAEALNRDGELDSTRTLAVIDEIVAHLCKTLSVEKPELPAVKAPESETPEGSAPTAAGAPRKPDAPPLPATAVRRQPGASGKMGLKLISNRRLGELMVQMSMLTPAQVEQALSHQRMTGCRFGDALIQMRILPREAVDSVLRLQSARRATGTDDWGPGR